MHKSKEQKVCGDLMYGEDGLFFQAFCGGQVMVVNGDEGGHVVSRAVLRHQQAAKVLPPPKQYQVQSVCIVYVHLLLVDVVLRYLHWPHVEVAREMVNVTTMLMVI